MPNRPYKTDLSDGTGALVVPLLPAARPGGRPRTTDIRAVVNAIFYLLRTGCQWRFASTGVFRSGARCITYFRAWKNAGVWTCLQRAIYQQVRKQAGRSACPSLVIMDGQSVKTTERGGVRGFDGHKLVKGRKRHILVDTLGFPIACRVEPANISDRRAVVLLLGGLRPLFPAIRTVIADAGHENKKLARMLKVHEGWELRIIKRRQRAFQITGLTWIVERTFAWLGRNRRLSKDYEYAVQTSERSSTLRPFSSCLIGSCGSDPFQTPSKAPPWSDVGTEELPNRSGGDRWHRVGREDQKGTIQDGQAWRKQATMLESWQAALAA